MNDSKKRRLWRPTPVGLAAGGLCIAGFLLTGIDWGLPGRPGAGPGWRAMVIIFFMGPLLTAGIALLRCEREEEVAAA